MKRRYSVYAQLLSGWLVTGLWSAGILNPEAAATGARQAQPSIARRSEGESIFASLLTTLRQKTRIPIKLPRYVPYDDDKENPLYGILEVAESDRYSIELAWLPACKGGNACHVGYIGGSSTPFPETDKVPVVVKLADNIAGSIRNFDCGAHCDDASIDWTQGGYYYGISLKAGDKQTLIRMAKSAIRSSQTRKMGANRPLRSLPESGILN